MIYKTKPEEYCLMEYLELLLTIKTVQMHLEGLWKDKRIELFLRKHKQHQ
jgi:hypothetical protein